MATETAADSLPTNLVLCGCGIKMFAHSGALVKLEELNYLKNITHYAGTSSGAIMCTMHAIGYTAEEMMCILLHLDFTQAYELNFNNLMTAKGIDTRERYTYIISTLFAAKGISSTITFAQLHAITQKHLQLCATCLNTQSAEYFSHVTTPDVKVIDVLNATVAIPFMFSPVTIGTKTYVDGAITDNYPMKLFAAEPDRTLGLCIDSSVHETDTIDSIFQIMMLSANCMHINYLQSIHDNYADNTIFIDGAGISTVNYLLSADEKQLLVTRGKEAVERFFLKDQAIES